MPMIPGRIYPYSMITIPVTFRDQYGTPGDPDTLTFMVRAPDGTVTSQTFGESGAQIEQVGTGQFNADFDVDHQTGRWHWRFEATSGSGLVASSGEGSFVVQASPFYDDRPSDYGR